MTPEDRKMYEKGYRYRCIPSDKCSSPYMDMYAKDMEMVSIILRDWPAQRFNVVKLVCWLDEAITSISTIKEIRYVDRS